MTIANDDLPPVPASYVARQLLGRSPAWFTVHRGELEAAGFPKPIPVSGRYRLQDVQVWLDGGAPSSAESAKTLAGRAALWGKSA
jgi:hypothetical protein